MCMISEEIESVNNTKIFCGLNAKLTKQLTIYSNDVNNISNNNAMVLPVPFAESVNFYDLSNYKNFFEDCDKCFESRIDGNALRSLSYSNDCFNDSLEVHDIGSYKVSLAHNLSDLHRVNKNVFHLSEGLDKILKKNYSNSHFGFIICKLSKGNESYHPFAYSHKIFNSKVFIPTRHYHGQHENDSNNGTFGMGTFADALNWSNFKKAILDDDYADDWDHSIYLYNVNINSNAEVKKMNKSRDEWNKKNKINFNKLEFDLDKNCREFKKLKISGSNPNIDLILFAV